MASIPVNPQMFTGAVSAVGPEFDEADDCRLVYISFPVGVRNKFHIHSTAQTLIVTEGRVVVSTRHESVEVGVGDIVVTPADEEHSHGAAPGSTATHLSILASGSMLRQTEE
jgi:4-carboxymuconolactone decarboxylase